MSAIFRGHDEAAPASATIYKKKFRPWGLTDTELGELVKELAKDDTADIDRAEKLIFAATAKAVERAHAEPLAATFEGPPS